MFLQMEEVYIWQAFVHFFYQRQVILCATAACIRIYNNNNGLGGVSYSFLPCMLDFSLFSSLDDTLLPVVNNSQ
jgi:hypothetical protein